MGWPKKNGKKYIDVNKHETTTNKKEYIKTHKKKKNHLPTLPKSQLMPEIQERKEHYK